MHTIVCTIEFGLKMKFVPAVLGGGLLINRLLNSYLQLNDGHIYIIIYNVRYAMFIDKHNMNYKYSSLYSHNARRFRLQACNIQG